MLDALAVDAARIHAARQAAGVFLLALDVRHGGAFAPFDGLVAASAVHHAGRRHLVVL